VVSRGVVLWPDSSTSVRIRGLWQMLADRGLPSMATHTHELHQPHVSLIVAEDLPVIAVLEVVGSVPPEPIPFRIEAVGVFPGGFLFLACVANEALLAEQRRVHNATEPFRCQTVAVLSTGDVDSAHHNGLDAIGRTTGGRTARIAVRSAYPRLLRLRRSRRWHDGRALAGSDGFLGLLLEAREHLICH
jgi:hypothetical protein